MQKLESEEFREAVGRAAARELREYIEESEKHQMESDARHRAGSAQIVDTWLSWLMDSLEQEFSGSRSWRGNTSAVSIGGKTFGGILVSNEFETFWDIKVLAKNGLGQNLWVDCGFNLSAIERALD